MKLCFCKRLYNLTTQSAISEYAFGGSLCRIREFETADGLRYCLTVFSLSDYKHLHFPHDEYKCMISKLNDLRSTQTRLANTSNSDMVTIEELPFKFKIKFGNHSLKIGPFTAFGLLKTAPFTEIDTFPVDPEDPFTCDLRLDICTCKTCPVFKRLIDFEASALERFPQRKVENVILSQ